MHFKLNNALRILLLGFSNIKKILKILQKNMRFLLLIIFIPIAGLKVLNFFIHFYNLLMPSLKNKLQSIYLSESKPHPYDFY